MKNKSQNKFFQATLAVLILAFAWFAFGFATGCFFIAAYPPSMEEGVFGGLLFLAVSAAGPDLYIRWVSGWVKDKG